MAISAAELRKATEEAARQTGYNLQARVTPLKRVLGIILLLNIVGGGALCLYGGASGQSLYAKVGFIFLLGGILQAFVTNTLRKRRDPQYRVFIDARDKILAPSKKRERSVAFARAGMAFLLFIGVLIVSIAQHSSAAFAHLGKAPFYVVALLPLGAGLFIVLRNKRTRESKP